ncbi:ABC transporter ATP-binding protein [Streptomyces sp. NPDC004111]|uniref:ABC transporter ATP-binding protein n=1 Tax=Streptomyces sp. NPDC004111 TaxID=3364690 RepID=UPI0036C29258
MSTIRAECRELGIRYGSRRVIDRVDLALRAGVTGLLGPNGAGKTSLLRCLATTQAPTSGSVRLFGLDTAVAPQRTQARRQLGYLPQDPGFYPQFTVYEQLDYIAVLKEIDEPAARHRQITDVLDQVGLRDRAADKVRKLSGGMRQRLGLAQALLGAPGLLVLDEPTVGLDPEQRMRFRTVVSRHGAAGTTVLLSTHQTEDVAALCDRVLVLVLGSLVFDGTPQELADHARGRVWLTEDPPAGSEMGWRGPDGRYRLLGERPPVAAAEESAPTIEDGYLLLLHTHGRRAATA